MADQAQIPEKGSGEGSTEVKPTENAPVESKPLDPVQAEGNVSEIDKAQPEKAEVKEDAAQASQTITADVKKIEENQIKAPEVNVEDKPPAVVSNEKEENPIKETVLVTEIFAVKVEAQSQDAPTVPVETKEAIAVPSNEAQTDDTKSQEPKLPDPVLNENQPKENGDWQQREQQLLKKIEDLEKFKNERTEDGLKLELKVREEEIDLLKARVKNLETELQAALSKPGGKNQEMVEKIKLQHEELLSKARGMIFDKTKMVKNQELQIEALTTQVQSLKDINLITKDLLEIRNSEVKAMEDRLHVMEARFKAEKERYDLVLKRAQTSTTINDDLRREYETQLGLFKELREKYELRVQALVAENTRLKDLANGATSG